MCNIGRLTDWASVRQLPTVAGASSQGIRATVQEWVDRAEPVYYAYVHVLCTGIYIISRDNVQSSPCRRRVHL